MSKKTQTFLAGGAVGIVVFLLIFGVNVLNFTDDSWLLQGSGFTGDLTQHYIGWLFLRKSEWSFPLGLIDGLCYPDKISVIYTDSIPLFALFFKLFSPILPKSFQYFGLWGLVCSALQGGFGALLVLNKKNNVLLGTLGALFFVTASVFLQRMFYHSALAAHFMILAPLCLWKYSDEITLKKKFIYWGILSFLCASVNLYFTPMVLGILFFAAIDEFINKRNAKILLTVPAAVAEVLASMWLLGGFYGGVSGKMGGLGVFSFNLNGLYNPQDNSFFAKTQPLYQAGQNEGFSYLGLGVIMLISAVLLYFFSHLGFKAKNVPYVKIICIFVFTVLAISPDVSFNEKLLFAVPYPEWAMNILAVFRSSGRFIWIPFYIILAVLLSCVANMSKTTATALFTALCVTIQAIDLSPMIKSRINFFYGKNRYETPLKSEKWDELGKESKHIMFCTPLWNLYVNPDYAYTFAEYADRYDMTLNGTYFSRDLSDKVNEATFSRLNALAAGEKFNDFTLYVFPDGMPENVYNLDIFEVDGYWIGREK